MLRHSTCVRGQASNPTLHVRTAAEARARNMTALAASLAGCGAVGLLCTRPESALTAATLGFCRSRPVPPPAAATRAPARCGACSGWRGPQARRGRCAAPSRGSTAGAAGRRRTWPSTSRRCCRTALRAPARDQRLSWDRHHPATAAGPLRCCARARVRSRGRHADSVDTNNAGLQCRAAAPRMALRWHPADWRGARSAAQPIA